MFTVISAISLFVLAAFVVTGLNGPARWNTFNAKDAPQGRKTSSSKTRATGTGDKYLLGVGKADITGPVVEIEFAGYASASQTGTGLRQRIHSRAFIIGDVDNPDDRFVYVILDTASGDTAVRYGVLDALAALGSEYAVYGNSNLALTGTHSHSGPGAWWNYLLPQITSLGFDKQSYQAIVDGAILSIQRAHESLDEVSLRL
jgi:neutral ceramidase